MDNRTRNVLTFEAVDIVQRAFQAGRDEMAQVLADWLTEQRQTNSDDEVAGHYLDGIEDALCTLVQAGATDPRHTEQDQQDQGDRS